jgi:hypothetical protein
MGEKRKICKVLVRKHEGKRPLGRLRRGWEDGIRVDLTVTGWGVIPREVIHGCPPHHLRFQSNLVYSIYGQV